jgi:hypothetical protein
MNNSSHWKNPFKINDACCRVISQLWIPHYFLFLLQSRAPLRHYSIANKKEYLCKNIYFISIIFYIFIIIKICNLIWINQKISRSWKAFYRKWSNIVDNLAVLMMIFNGNRKNKLTLRGKFDFFLNFLKHVFLDHNPYELIFSLRKGNWEISCTPKIGEWTLVNHWY